MTSIKIPNDDQGIRNARVDVTQPAVSQPVLPVRPSKPVQPSPSSQSVVTPHSERRVAERRQHERRVTDSTPFLDTRSNHDRRTKAGHRKEDYSKEEPQEENLNRPVHGINKKV